MFTKTNKNDPLIESIKNVMEHNDLLRRVESVVNEHFGITSKKALPHEYHAEYDALFEETKRCSMEEEKKDEEKKTPSATPEHHRAEAIRIHKAMKSGGKMPYLVAKKKEHEDAYKRMTGKNIDYPKDLDEAKDEGSTPRNAKEKALAKLHGNPNKITHGDVLKGRGVVEEESSNDHGDMIAYHENLADKHGQVGMGSDHNDAAKAHEKAVRWHGVAQKSLDKNGSNSSEYKADAKQANMATAKAKEATRNAGGALAKQLKEEQINEKAPPGAKFERMVKHIKQGYGKDGLTKKEKSIAYATAWKAKNNGEGKSMAEETNIDAILEEIRTNLEEQLAYVYENYDEASFAEYVDSLTEEQLEILGLNEGKGKFLGKIFGGAEAPKALPKPTGTSVATRSGSEVSPNVKPVRKQEGPIEGGKLHATDVPKQAQKALPAPAPSGKTPSSGSRMPGKRAAVAATVAAAPALLGGSDRGPAPQRSAGGAQGGVRRQGGSAKPGAGARPGAVSGGQKPKLKPKANKPTFRTTNTSDIGTHMARSFGGVVPESYEQPIKESFEQFLRNKFLKG